MSNLHQTKMDAKAVGPLRFALWKFGRKSERNQQILFSNLMSRVIPVFDRNDASKGQDEITAAEQGAVKDLEALLEAAIQESQA